MLITSNKLSQITGAFLVFCSFSVMAGTILEVNSAGERTTMLTDGKLARLNMASQEYVIIDYRKELVKVVDTQNRQVMVLDLRAAANKAPPGNKVIVSLKNLGAAQNVAGYATNKFEYMANGRSCGVLFASKRAYQEKGIKDLMSAMQTMLKKQQSVLGGFAGFVDDCTLADMELTGQVGTIGLPMRSLKNGIVENEIKSIKVDVALPADTFSIPAGFKSITLQDKIKQASKGLSNTPPEHAGMPPSARQQGMPQAAQMQPQIQEMMRQMQQSGQLTPEMMEQMRRSQQMMQQYQQR